MASKLLTSESQALLHPAGCLSHHSPQVLAPPVAFNNTRVILFALPPPAMMFNNSASAVALPPLADERCWFSQTV